MELDDFKNTWNETSCQAKKMQNINAETLGKRYKGTYRSKLKQIVVSEIAGCIVCLGSAVFIGFRFNKLDTSFLQVAGIVSILLLLAIPVISLLSTYQLNRLGNPEKPYAETLRDFAIQKKRFIMFQKLNVMLCHLLLVAVILLLSKLFIGKDLSGNKYFWIFSFSIGYMFLLFYSKWVEKYYRKTMQEAENLLAELSV